MDISFDENGKIIPPDFPRLKSTVKSINEQLDFLNTQVIPYLRDIGISKGSGLTGRLIFAASSDPDCLPDCPKMNIGHRNFLSFSGQKVFLNEQKFFEWYNTTREGKRRTQFQEMVRQFSDLNKKNDSDGSEFKF